MSIKPLIGIETTIGEQVELKAVIDSGATHSCINDEMYTKLLRMKKIIGELPYPT